MVKTGIAIELMHEAQLPVAGLAIVEGGESLPNHSYYESGGVTVRVHWARDPEAQQISQVEQIIREQTEA